MCYYSSLWACVVNVAIGEDYRNDGAAWFKLFYLLYYRLITAMELSSEVQ